MSTHIFEAIVHEPALSEGVTEICAKSSAEYFRNLKQSTRRTEQYLAQSGPSCAGKVVLDPD